LVFSLSRSIVDAETGPNHRLAAPEKARAFLKRRPGHGHARREVGLYGFVDGRIRRQDNPFIDIEDHLPILILAQRRIILVTQPIVEGQIRFDLPLVLYETDVILLLGEAVSRRAVVEWAGRADVTVILNGGG